MSRASNKVDDIRQDILGFVRDVATKREWDIIVPIMRKGLFVLLNSLDGYQDRIILPPFHGVSKLSQKAILILDDKAWHGHTMERKYKEIIGMGARRENVKTSVFMKHISCDFPIDYYRYRFGDLEYEKKEAEISEYFDSSCLQLDPDHLMAQGIVARRSLDTTDLKRFSSAVENTQNLGLFYPEEESEANLCGIMRFGIADIPFSMLDLQELRKMLKEEGVQKLRFCLELNGQLVVTPIFCPEINVNQKICKAALSNGAKLCDHISLEISEEFCRNCLNFNLQIKALRSLLRILNKGLKNEGFAICIEKLSWPELEYRFREVRSLLMNSLKGL